MARATTDELPNDQGHRWENLFKVGGVDFTLDRVRQYYIGPLEEAWKFDVLSDLHETFVITQAIVYCSNPAKVKALAEQMTQREMPSFSAMHSEMSEVEREAVHARFRSGETRVLLSDVRWHGVRERQLEVAVNYDMPSTPEDYLARIGRTDKFYVPVVAINCCCSDELGVLSQIQQRYGTEIAEMPMNVADIL